MSSPRSTATGARLATLLAGSWRRIPSPLSADAEELDVVAGLLLGGGAAGLVWRRCNHAPAMRASFSLREAFRIQAIGLSVRELEVAGLVRTLESAGATPLLGKGWAIAREYPEAGLRPCGDIDLYVRPQHYEASVAALAGHALAGVADVHCGIRILDDRDFDEIVRRSRRVTLAGGTIARVFGVEDHLRLLALHLLGHGAWRPLWLCDVALALETRPAAFDWDYFLSGERRRTGWVACTLVLAHQLLEARLEGVPASLSRRLPAWLVPAVLRQWGESSFVPHGRRRPMWEELRLGRALNALRTRWPNPIEASIGVGAAFDEMPRWPLQMAECIRRTGAFVRQGLADRMPRRRGTAAAGPDGRQETAGCPR